MDTDIESRNTNGVEASISNNGVKAPNQAEQDMLFSLKSNIDKYGRYGSKLTDMAQGYAAGRGGSSFAARRDIENKFAMQFGVSPKQYLDQAYAQRQQMGVGR